LPCYGEVEIFNVLLLLLLLLLILTDYKKAQQEIRKMSVDIPKLQKRAGKGMKRFLCFFNIRVIGSYSQLPNVDDRFSFLFVCWNGNAFLKKIQVIFFASVSFSF